MTALPIVSGAFVVLFSALFIRDYRFWKEMKEWPTVKRMSRVTYVKDGEVTDTDREYAKEFKHKWGAGGEALFEIAEHNLITSIIGWIASACLMALDVYLSLNSELILTLQV